MREPDDGDELTSDVIDLDGVDLADLEALPDSAFAASIARILADDQSTDRYAGFANTA